jgi:glycosyltransferase involved in cell wall biosynthesis
MFYSIIIPVYNRPGELDELLESLTHQTYTNFEVIVIDDGSFVPCKNIVEKHKKTLPVRYLYKSNSGPGLSRNYGAKESKGEYLIFLDSDCIAPPQYLMNVEQELAADNVDFFGGADKAHVSFSNIQKAINYSMTSILTTGGIRGSNKSIDSFYPRSFNMGISKKVFEHAGGFSEMRFGEDIDFSINVINRGYKSRLFTSSWVYHKRRTDLKKFFKQIFNSGIARINLYKKHPKSLKAVHTFPALFTLYIFVSPFLSFLWWFIYIPFCLFVVSIFIDALIKTKSIRIGLLSVIASFIQLLAYGLGFLYAFIKNIILRHNMNSVFDITFYK